MDGARLAREYVLLALRMHRVSPGTLAAFTGDRRLSAMVAGEALSEPRALAGAARLLRSKLSTSDLDRSRHAFLRASLAALEWQARELAGARGGYRAELRTYFQVRPEFGARDDYARAHRELAALLPGSGTLSNRLARHRDEEAVPMHRLEHCVRALSAALAERTRAVIGLPEHERVEYRFGTGAAAGGLQHYLGRNRSRVSIDIGRRMSTTQLAGLLAHEAYPGHHTEHCRAGLAWGDEQPERTVFCLNTPRFVISEGAADLGLAVLIGPGWGWWMQDVLADVGVRVDGALAEAVAEARIPLRPVRQDAALLLHDERCAPGEVLDYLRRWALLGEDTAAAVLRFLGHPLWRTASTAYVEGYRLVRRWLDASPEVGPPHGRYLRLLDEPLLPSTIRAELASAGVYS